MLSGYCTQNKKKKQKKNKREKKKTNKQKAYFVLYLKIINTFLRNK